MSRINTTHDVVIVGAGIAGGALAAVLARAGVEVLLLEKSETFADRVRTPEHRAYVLGEACA
jgi:flavin-dependent dehydrogenase